MRKFITLMLLLGWGSAFAVPVTWTLEETELVRVNEVNQIIYSDRVSISGQFDFDSDTGLLSNMAITTTPVSLNGALSTPVFTSGFYNEVNETNNNCQGFHACIWFDDVGLNTATGPQAFGLRLDFTAPLSGAGGTLSLSPARYVLLARTFECDVYGFNSPDCFTANYTLVPVPAAVWLFASGLGLLGWLRGRAL